MSLNWDFTNEEVFNKLPKTDEEKHITELIIWGTMATGLDKITEKNIDTWLSRCYMLEKVNMPLGQTCIGGGKGFKPWSPTQKNLEDRIGLATNADQRTDAWFRRKIGGEIEKLSKAKVQRERKAKEKKNKEELTTCN